MTLLEQIKQHQILVDEFDIAKIKIKTLTGVKLKVITSLTKELKDSILVDEKSGTIKFSSNILFDQGKSTLKKGSKKSLEIILKKYLTTLLLNENIKQYIDNITIQGYTNSDGNYLYNLELSQKRALEVMKFLYKLNILDEKILSKYINASGRAYSNLIYKNGKEDKDASRRIEVNFSIKNEEAIKQLSNYINKKRGK